MKCLEGMNAVVTGASKGSGAAMAVALAEAGANVSRNYNGSQEAAEALAQRCRSRGVRASLAHADVGDQSEVERMIAETVEDFGGLDIAVSNAAYGDRELFHMSKAAIDQMAGTAATELASRRIRVNTIHPGWIDTPGERKFCSEDTLQTLGAELPWGRLGKPEEIARGVVFLCDPASDYITFADFSVLAP